MKKFAFVSIFLLAAFVSCGAPNPADTTDGAITADTTVPVTEPITEPVTEPITEPVTEPVTEPIVEGRHSDLGAKHTEGDVQLKISAGGLLAKGALKTTVKVPETNEAGLVFKLSAPEGDEYFESEKGLSYYYFAVTSEKTVHLYRVENGEKKMLAEQKLVLSAFASGKTAEMSVVFDETDIYCYLGNRCFIRYTDENMLTGEHFGRRQDAKTSFTVIYSTTDATPKKADILIFGHSHTQAWTSAENALKSYGKTLNIGIGSTNTVYWKRLVDEIESYSPKIIIVMSGSNDYGGGINNEVTMMHLDELYTELRARLPELKVIQITEFLQPKRVSLAAEVRDFNARLLEYENANGEWFKVVDAYDIPNKAKDVIDLERFRDDYHIKAEYYDVLDERMKAALEGSYVFPDREEALSHLISERNDEKHLFTVGTKDNWRIETLEDGSLRYISLVKNSMLMFKDITFSGGIIEFDMTVNVTTEHHNYKSANGVIFGSDTLCATHSYGHHYVFGRCAWGTMTGYSKDDPDFLWEDAVKGMKGIAVGKKQHYKLEWDSEKGTVTYYVNGKITGTTPLERKFNGVYCGIYCDSANTVIENLTFTEK